MRLIVILLMAAAVGAAQNKNPACPGATPPSMTVNAHCVTLTWTPPVLASAAPALSAYNVYRETTSGTCVNSGLAAAGCTKVATVVPPIAGGAPAATYVDNSNTTNVLTEGTTFYYVVTAVSGPDESIASNEFAAVIPFLPNPPNGLGGTPK